MEKNFWSALSIGYFVQCLDLRLELLLYESIHVRMCKWKFSFLLVISNHSSDCCMNCTITHWVLLHFNLLCFRARNEGLTNAALCKCSVLGSHTVLWDKGIYLTSRYDFDTTLLRRWNLKNRRPQRFLHLVGWAVMIKFLTDL